MFKTVTAKLTNMRKPQNFIVQRDQVNTYLVQSDKSIGKFDGEGRGVLNTTGSHFMHLTPFLGAKAYLFPGEFVQECQEIFMLPGEKIGDLGKSPVMFGGLTTISVTDDPVKASDITRTYINLDNLFSSHNKIVVEKGTSLWNVAESAYLPYDGSPLLGKWHRRSLEDLMVYFKEVIGE